MPGYQFSGNANRPGSGPHSKAVQIEVMGIDSTLGLVDVEEDGSFYLKVAADTPFRIKTLDKDGEVVNGPGSWIYVRPNERRGCIGCHENRELVPENRQPLSWGDLDNELSRIAEAGGKVLQGKTQISPEHGYMALFTDCEGNRIALHSRE